MRSCPRKARGHRRLWLISKVKGAVRARCFRSFWTTLFLSIICAASIDAFVARLALSELGFERAQAAETGRPGYDPRDFLKLYLYGYLNQIRSSRRLEAECRRNVELMWLLGRLHPDHKSISEFRRVHAEAVVAAGAALVRFAQSCGLIRGEWIAIDGSKFRAVASVDSTRERLDLQRYLDSIENADEEQHPFATIKYRIFGHPRLLMRGLTGARAEIGIATMAYNLKRITNVLGAAKLTTAIRQS